MQDKNLVRHILEISVVVVFICTMSVAAMPGIARMFDSNYESSSGNPEPVGYIAGMELPERASLTGYSGELYSCSCGFIEGAFPTQVLPDCSRRVFLVTLFSIDYVLQFLTGQIAFEIFAE